MLVGCEKLVNYPGCTGRPRLLLAYSDSEHAARCVRYFRRLGWEVHMVASGTEAQRLAIELQPDVIVLDIDLTDETGWLSAAKILLVQSAQRVLLLADDTSETRRERARSLGAAAVVRRWDGPEAIAAHVFDRPLSVAV